MLLRCLASPYKALTRSAARSENTLTSIQTGHLFGHFRPIRTSRAMSISSSGPVASNETTTTPPVSAPKHEKLGGYDFYRSIGSPKWVVAPMVDQSELAWRMLSRSPLPSAQAGPSTLHNPSTSTPVRYPGGAHLTYTPMIHAKTFVQSKPHARGGDPQFNLSLDEEGGFQDIAGIEGGDRPLFVQFCANDPEILLKAARKVEGRCDAVDINLGCPQGIAKRGHYGAFLQDEWDLIRSMISTLHENLSIPVTAKFRIFPDLARTIEYAKMLESAGAQIITCHGRTREMKGQVTGLADWEVIREVKKAVKIPVFANGNILYREDVDKCLEVTGCDGVMTAEGNLSNPALFLDPDHPHAFTNVVTLADRYLDIVESLKTPTASSAIKGHLFRMFKPVLDTDENLRIMIARAHYDPFTPSDGLKSFRDVVREIERRIEPEVAKAGPSWKPPPIDPATGYRDLPIFAAQPYIRPTPISAKVASHEELEEADDSRITDTPRSSSPAPSLQVNARCIYSSPEAKPCGGVAAMRCPTGACLVHCRVIRAAESGMTPQEAQTEGSRGRLVGMGCEAHEAKETARKDRNAEKRKNKTVWKQVAKQRKIDAGGKKQKGEQDIRMMA